MLIIGLTGGIGSGKSTVVGLFRKLGIGVIDADEIAHQLVEPGNAALENIANLFGQEYLQPDGSLDRRRMRQRIFSDPVAKEKLESILHPLIREEMLEQGGKLESPYCIFSIPLLFEQGWQDMVDRVLVIDCTVELQIQRICKRDNITEQEAMAIINSQIDRSSRLQAADDIIENSDDMASLADKVNVLHKHYLQLAHTY